MKRVFSGVQPSGNLHLGNYLGAVKQFADLQDMEHECVYCVVDEHSITVPQDPKVLRSYIKDIASIYIACGVDPKKSIIFVQSDVPGHAELGWILMCNAYTGELSRMTQFKDKSHGKESVGAGLFAYPVLMAADILLYDTNLVPVGSDQKQHVELCRDLAIRMNGKYGDDTFVVPDVSIKKEGARVMALDDPTIKMSKSAPNPLSRIDILADATQIKKAIMKATTDSDGEVRFDVENKPGVSNLLNIYSVLSGKDIASLEKDYIGHGYGDFKKDLVEVAVEALRPIQEKYQAIRNSDELELILKDGANRANEISERTMRRIKDKIGFGL